MTLTVTDLAPRLTRRIVVADRPPANPSRPLDTPCWLWTGGKFPEGYGSYWHDGRSVLVHRHVYEQLVAPLPPRGSGQWLDHVCRVRACCNPEHLDLVSPRENQLRRADVMSATCSNGHLWSENARPVKGRPTQRRCMACERARGLAYRAKKLLQTLEGTA